MSTESTTAKKAAAPAAAKKAAPATPAAPASTAKAESAAPSSASDNGSAEAPSAPSDKDVKAAQQPGAAPSAFIPNPDTVTGLSSAHAGPMQGGDESERDAYVAASGPLVKPTDRELQTYPAKGYGLSSTDSTYAAAGGRTVSGEQFASLVGEDGKAVSAGDLFNDEDGKGFVTASKRVFEEFYYPNTIEKAKRLLFVAGQKVDRAEAERIKATLA